MTASSLKLTPSDCACSPKKTARPRRALATVVSPSRTRSTTRRPAAHTLPNSNRVERTSTHSLPRSRSSRSASPPRTGSSSMAPPGAASPVASILRGCFNCGRGGVMPGQMIADENGNRFCSAECGWSYLVQPPATQAVLRTTPRRLTSRKATVDESKQFYQDLANVERVDHLLLKKLHRNPKYQRAMEALPRRGKQTTPPLHEGRENKHAARAARRGKMLAVQQTAREQVPEHVGALSLFQGLFGD